MSGFQCFNGIAPCNSTAAIVSADQGSPELGSDRPGVVDGRCRHPRDQSGAGSVLPVLPVHQPGLIWKTNPILKDTLTGGLSLVPFPL